MKTFNFLLILFFSVAIFNCDKAKPVQEKSKPVIIKKPYNSLPEYKLDENNIQDSIYLHMMDTVRKFVKTVYRQPVDKFNYSLGEIFPKEDIYFQIELYHPDSIIYLDTTEWKDRVEIDTDWKRLERFEFDSIGSIIHIWGKNLTFKEMKEYIKQLPKN